MLDRFKVPPGDRVYVMPDRIRAATEAVFRKMGVDKEGARTCTDVLITNDLRGIETHGVSNMLRRYVREYSEGRLNPNPAMKVVRETRTTATVDGDRALGLHVGPAAMGMAIAKAREYGIGAVSVFNSGHLGGCGYYAMMAAEQDMIGHCMTAGGARQTLPTWGAEPRLGTNPIAYAAPARRQAPFLFDVATTQVAGNKIALARRLGISLLGTWIAREDGTPITEETPVPEKYYMLHAGGTRENGSHKGYGFALMNEIMCNELSGVGPGFLIQGSGGHFFAAYRIDAFTDLEKFKD
ncbi:MAG: Ldh family oxidoreductase, partial [Gemmatimonadetes bacterium]|nr:Ldh family oxidoreductase [Gemmatimonadota bacterium]